jgi:hypothetical protein
MSIFRKEITLLAPNLGVFLPRYRSFDKQDEYFREVLYIDIIPLCKLFGN